MTVNGITASPDGPRVKLMLAAERIIGEVGFQAASLRQIAGEAGYKNVRAVQYHFDNKETVVSAILAMRRAEMDYQRLRLFAASGRSLDQHDNLSLIKYLIIPPFEQRDEEGRRSFARFYQATIPVLYRFDDMDNLETTAPFTFTIFDELRKRNRMIDGNNWPMIARATAIITFNFIANFDTGSMRPLPSEGDFLDQLARLNLAIINSE